VFELAGVGGNAEKTREQHKTCESRVDRLSRTE